MDAVERMEFLREVLIGGENFRKQVFSTVSFHCHVVEEIGAESTGSPEDSCFRGGAIDDGLPFRFEQWEVVIAEPIHVIEQDETGYLPVVSSEESFDRIGLDG